MLNFSRKLCLLALYGFYFWARFAAGEDLMRVDDDVLGMEYQSPRAKACLPERPSPSLCDAIWCEQFDEIEKAFHAGDNGLTPCRADELPVHRSILIISTFSINGKTVVDLRTLKLLLELMIEKGVDLMTLEPPSLFQAVHDAHYRRGTDCLIFRKVMHLLIGEFAMSPNIFINDNRQTLLQVALDGFRESVRLFADENRIKAMEQFVYFLIRSGASVHAENVDGENALSVLLSKYDRFAYFWLRRLTHNQASRLLNVVRELLRRGAHVDPCRGSGQVVIGVADYYPPLRALLREFNQSTEVTPPYLGHDEL